MQTLLEFLADEYRKTQPADNDLAKFLDFSDGYLSEHRPVSFSARMESNCEITLTGGTAVLVSPPVRRERVQQRATEQVSGSPLPRDLPPDDSVPILR